MVRVIVRHNYPANLPDNFSYRISDSDCPSQNTPGNKFSCSKAFTIARFLIRLGPSFQSPWLLRLNRERDETPGAGPDGPCLKMPLILRCVNKISVPNIGIEQVKKRTGSPHVILCDHTQNSCETCSQASVGETEKLHFAVTQDLLDAEPDYLRLQAVPENENAIERIPFSE
ncbi:hypothetical protein TNCV_2650531 [Trichonephila clavipes]|nr:hypothetical protein TNCV_2650531 [Trichonephila clavipes]